jgi:hypothetical protein
LRIHFASVELTGLNRDNLSALGSWSLNLLKPDIIPNWTEHRVHDFSNAGVVTQVGENLGPEQLAVGQVNQFVFTAKQLQLLEQIIQTTDSIGFRLDGPSGAAESFFVWDGGGSDPKTGAHPTLRIIAQPAPTFTPTALAP